MEHVLVFEVEEVDILEDFVSREFALLVGGHLEERELLKDLKEVVTLIENAKGVGRFDLIEFFLLLPFIELLDDRGKDFLVFLLVFHVRDDVLVFLENPELDLNVLIELKVRVHEVEPLFNQIVKGFLAIVRLDCVHLLHVLISRVTRQED